MVHLYTILVSFGFDQIPIVNKSGLTPLVSLVALLVLTYHLRSPKDSYVRMENTNEPERVSVPRPISERSNPQMGSDYDKESEI